MADLQPAAQRALCDLFYEDDGQWFVGAAPHSNVTAALKPVLAALGLPVEYPPGRHDLEQAELLALDHRPLFMAPRKGHSGEKAYAAMWEATMATLADDDNQPIQRVLRHMDTTITQRHASVLASVAMWLGTACGGAMLKHAERLRGAAGSYGGDEYLIAWTLENRRLRAVNHGIRTAEFLLAPASSWRSRYWLGECPLSEVPELSAEDLETIDCFMMWLSEGEGQQFLARAKLLDEQHCKEDAIMRRAEMNLAAASAEAKP